MISEQNKNYEIIIETLPPKGVFYRIYCKTLYKYKYLVVELEYN